MKTLKLIKPTRLHWSLLGLVLLGAALSLASPTARRFVRHRAAALSAALLPKPHTAPGQTFMVRTVPQTFTVRSYGGKCLEFGVPRRPIEQAMAKGYPVFISDCNGSAVQQVRIEELTDRPGHLVILRAGNGVIGKKVTPVFTQLTASEAQSDNGSNDSGAAEQASSAALVSTSTLNQIPLEVQPYTGSPEQIFALDGDSMILAADRNLVVEVQNHRGKNQTPLVLGRRDLDDSEFWTFTATDGSNRRPTSGFVRISQIDNSADGELRARADFLHAVFGAKRGTVIELDPSVSLNLSYTPPLHIPAGVTIRGDRRGTRLGPELRGGYGPNGMFEIAGDDVRITGLRLHGPSRSLADDTPEATGILAPDHYLRSIIDHNDMSDWSESAVRVRGEDWSEECLIRDHRDNPVPLARPRNVRVARNFLHHNQRWGSGYGVVVYYGAYPLIEGNTFVSNRHAIAADGRSRTGYSAQFNLVLAATPNYSDHGAQQDFDMHGRGSAADHHYVGGIAGEYMEIARNTFLGVNRLNFYLRGTPCYLAEFNYNISVDSLGDTIKNLGPQSKLIATGNQFNAPNPTNRLGVGDFDGDGKDDLFLATGAAWYYAPAGQAEWRFLNARTEKLESLLFGDFDADGRTDVFTQHGESKWDVSWGGASRWETINSSGPLLGNAAIGDFNGDGRDDVFYADGAQWFVSYSGTGMFTHMASAAHRVADLRFGDFNGDGKTDVFGVVGDLWMVVYGGTHYWAPLRAKLTDTVAELTVADFDGDGRADVARLHRAHGPKTSGFTWLISLSGTADWTTPRIAMPMNAAAFGRFDGNAGVDILLWGGDRHLYISSWGSGPSVLYSRQDMR
jgi:hypothetical protein